MAGNKTLVGTTKGGKEIYATTIPNRSLLQLQFGAGGVMPPELEGAFGSMTDAYAAADRYLEKDARKPMAKAAVE